MSDLFLREMTLREVEVVRFFVRVLDAVVAWLLCDAVDAVDAVDHGDAVDEVPSVGVCLLNVCVVSSAMSSLALIPLVIG